MLSLSLCLTHDLKWKRGERGERHRALGTRMGAGRRAGGQGTLPGRLGAVSRWGARAPPSRYPPPASAAGATGRGAGQAGDCGGAEQPHRGESPPALPLPSGHPTPRALAPSGCSSWGCRVGSRPGLWPSRRLWGADSVRALGCPRGQGRCWAAAWPWPTPPLSSSSSSSRCPTMLPPCPSPLALLAWWAAAPRGCWPCPEHWPPRLSWLRPPRRTGQVGRPRDPEVSGQHRVAGAGGQGWGGGLAGHPVQSTRRTEA